MKQMKHKAVSHRKQKSQDIGPRRSTAKPAKTREERAPLPSPAPPAFDIVIPKGLRTILVNSRAQIKQGNILVLPKEYIEYPNLPEIHKTQHVLNLEQKPPNVDEVCAEFSRYYLDATDKTLESPEKKEALVAVITRGILVYFQKTLPTNLLYMEERGQYAFLDNKYRTGIGSAHDTGDEPVMSGWYGADHLLRLLVKLPEILSLGSLDSYSINLIAKYVREMLDWMEVNKERLFLSTSLYRKIPTWYQTDIRSRASGTKTGDRKSVV